VEDGKETVGESKILEYLQSLEARLAKIESHVQRHSAEDFDEEEEFFSEPTGSGSDRLEYQIGQFWLARAGILLLTAGLIFLLTLPYTTAPAFVPSLIGLGLTVAILVLSHFWRESLGQFSRYLLGGGLVILYFTALRLAYFTDRPVVTSTVVEMGLLLLAAGISIAFALRRKSVYLTAISIAMGYATALVSDSPYAVFLSITILTTATVLIAIRKNWIQLITIGVVLTVTTHVLWFMNNPILGHEVLLVQEPYSNLCFVLLYAILFGIGVLARKDHRPEDNSVMFVTFILASLCYGLLLLLTISTFKDGISLTHLGAAIVFIGLSIAFWIRERSVYATFFFAMTGYMALSVSIVTRFVLPDFFVCLCLQSLIVISTAIWFRSRFIIVANFIIYLMVFLTYVIAIDTVNALSLVFGIVALVSARILHWRQDRLELKTDVMRTAYLLTALFIIPYSLFHMLSSVYVVISWIGVAVVYYLLSKILTLKKYRYMALATLLASVIYAFVLSVSSLAMEYKVVSFVALGVVLLVISAIYFKLSGSNHEKPDSQQNISNNT